MNLAQLIENKTCILCHKRKVYEIKSHLTPASITKNVYGERNKEEIYTINPYTKKIETYFGCQHTQTVNTEIKIAPNVRKGIFCKDCEENMGKYESECQSKLNTIINILGKGGYKISRTDEGTKFIDIGISRNKLFIFFLSIVWRQCIEQELDKNDSPLNSKELETLRQFLMEYLYVEIDLVDKVENLFFRRINLYTTYNTDVSTVATYVNPHSTESNPEMFFIGPIILLYWKLNEASNNIMDVIKNALNIEDNQLGIENGAIGIISNSNWKKITYNFAKKTVTKMME